MDNKDILKLLKKLDVINLYHLNKSSIPPEIGEEFEKNYDYLYFMFKVMIPFFTDMSDLVYALMMKQFPAFRKETRPSIVKDLKSITTAAGVDLITGLVNIINAKSEGKTTREFYAPFDEWVKNNTYPKDTWERVKDYERASYGAWESTKEEWAEIKKDENRFRRDEMEWIKKRRFEYIDVMQNTLLTYFKGFEMLDTDDLIVYGLLLRQEYEDYNNHCELIEQFIDWGLPEEDYTLNYSELTVKQTALGNEKRWEVSGMRYRRVYGEEV